jgi:hypothetical protein
VVFAAWSSLGASSNGEVEGPDDHARINPLDLKTVHGSLLHPYREAPKERANDNAHAYSIHSGEVA